MMSFIIIKYAIICDQRVFIHSAVRKGAEAIPGSYADSQPLACTLVEQVCAVVFLTGALPLMTKILKNED